MVCELTLRAQTVLNLANEEARMLNHDYVGTEHMLLGLVREESGLAASLLGGGGVSVDELRAAIVSSVHPGTRPVLSISLPLTPRSQRVLELARDEARQVNQPLVDVEHLLLALLSEPDGMAGRILRQLGVQAQSLRAEALKIRIALMTLVEQCVRPVRASIVRKRKMREELLAHLTGIYEHELGRHGDPAAALSGARHRFGDPAELARELDAAVPAYERISALLERWALYRSPESAVQYSCRLAFYSTTCLIAILGTVFLGLYAWYGWIPSIALVGRLFAAIVAFTPLLQFVVCLAYIKLRDAMWGAFGSRRSTAHVLGWCAIIVLFATLYLVAVAVCARQDAAVGRQVVGTAAVTAAISGVLLMALAYFTGPATIRDARWELLNLDAG
jgi:ATP-dependent Clp protease ATP-binding subunit ClpC